MSSKLVYLKCSPDGFFGAKQLLEDFLYFSEKISYFNAIRSHFALVQSHLKELGFMKVN